MKDIPLHQLRERTSSGFQVKRFRLGDPPDDDVKSLGAHRDDHYIFFLLEQGEASMMIDFHEVELQAGVLYYVLPTQVHHRIRNEVAAGWFIAIDTTLIAPDYRNVFENQLQLQQPVLLNDACLRQCHDLLCLLDEKLKEDEQSPFYIPVIHSLLQSFLGIAAGCFSNCSGAGYNSSRPVQLAQQFKKLLTDNIRTVKSPSAYAALLHVSESYLNEALKKTTGFPVSYWIQDEVIIEAKRLLFYSQLNVKEIAHTLGYEDHTYFSRLFKKATSTTPLDFRSNYHK